MKLVNVPVNFPHHDPIFRPFLQSYGNESHVILKIYKGLSFLNWNGKQVFDFNQVFVSHLLEILNLNSFRQTNYLFKLE